MTKDEGTVEKRELPDGRWLFAVTNETKGTRHITLTRGQRDSLFEILEEESA